MLCTKCNKEQPDDAKFCMTCGNSFQTAAAVETGINEPTVTKSKTELQSKTMIFIILVAVSLTLGIISLIYTLNKGAQIDQLTKNVQYLDQKCSLLEIASFISEGVVTNELVIQKADFGEGTLVFDIRPQPSFSEHFVGQGRFDLSDRQLKASLSSLLNKLKETYNSFSNSNKPTFENLKITITENNYDVATFTNGKLKLVGEQ